MYFCIICFFVFNLFPIININTIHPPDLYTKICNITDDCDYEFNLIRNNTIKLCYSLYSTQTISPLYILNVFNDNKYINTSCQNETGYFETGCQIFALHSLFLAQTTCVGCNSTINTCINNSISCNNGNCYYDCYTNSSCSQNSSKNNSFVTDCQKSEQNGIIKICKPPITLLCYYSDNIVFAFFESILYCQTIYNITLLGGIGGGVVLLVCLCCISLCCILCCCCCYCCIKRNKRSQNSNTDVYTITNKAMLNKKQSIISDNISKRGSVSAKLTEIQLTVLSSKNKRSSSASFTNPILENSVDLSTITDTLSPLTESTVSSRTPLYVNQPNQYNLTTIEKRCTESDITKMYEAFINGVDLNEGADKKYLASVGGNPISENKKSTIVYSKLERELVKSASQTYFNVANLPDRSKLMMRFFSTLDDSEKFTHTDDLGELFNLMSNRNFREINPETLDFMHLIGVGHFSEIFNAQWNSPYGKMPVAVKILKDKSNLSSLQTDFIHEAAIIGQFEHPNLLKLIGIVSLTDPLMIITELMKEELKRFLVKLNTSKLEKTKFSDILLKFSKDIALGMNYLSEKNFIHRDLASRNVLISENFTCKIADFGISVKHKDEQDYYTTSKKKIPVRWTSPEAVFYERYSEKSDVWSYGATLYEIWSLGYKPLYEYSGDQVLDLLQTNLSLSPPTGCPRSIYKLIVDTWRYEPENRPSFKSILISLDGVKFLTKSKKTYDDLSLLLGNDPLLSKHHYMDLQAK